MKIGFGKKKENDLAPFPSSSGRPPTERVASLSAQGMSEPEIIRTLRTEGYSPLDVDRAMKEALRSAVRPSAPRGPPAPPLPQAPVRRRIFEDDLDVPPAPTMRPPQRPMPEPPFANDDMISDNELELPRFPGATAPPRRPLNSPPMPMEDRDLDDLEPIAPQRPAPKEQRMQSRREYEEIAEGIVDEKWNTVEKRLDDMGDRVKELTVRVNNMQQAFDRLQGERRGDVAEITDKIETYKQSMSEVSSRMEGMERTMKDSMTPMMQSLRSLSDAVRAFKETRR